MRFLFVDVCVHAGGSRSTARRLREEVVRAREVFDFVFSRPSPCLHCLVGWICPPELKPGGYHVMLMDLKQALPKDSTIPLTLVFRDAKGTETKTELKLSVNAMVPAAMPMDHGGHK